MFKQEEKLSFLQIHERLIWFVIYYAHKLDENVFGECNLKADDFKYCL